MEAGPQTVPQTPQEGKWWEGGQKIQSAQEFNTRRLNTQLDRLTRNHAGRRSQTKTERKRGHYIQARTPRGDKVTDLAFDATLRAAAPHQINRDRSEMALKLHKEDLREKVRVRRSANLILFVVDASWSMAVAERMEATKGAIMSLLTDAYQRRDRVGLIVFHKNDANLVLPPTNSVQLAKKALIDIAVGGKTPLSAGLMMALEVFRKAYRLSEDGKVVGDPDLKDHYYYFRERFESYRFDGIAGALQKFTEEMTCSLVDYWMKKTGKTRVVLSGGVSLNIKANMEIGKLDSVKDIFVCGSGGDESLSMGALFAYLDEAGRGGEIKSLPCLYLGGAIDQKESEAALAEVPNLADYEVVRDPTPQDVARHLADGKIIARMQDRMEFGARALGNRSILADPRSSKTIKKINYQIKKRDFWMPFTPSMLKEEEDAFLSNPKGFQYPYMSVACETTDKGKASLSAALHPADETARPQLVEEHINPGYHALLKAFKEITGVGALLNTSLNLHGYPIARTAREGLFVFLNSKLDGLWFSNILILRK